MAPPNFVRVGGGLACILAGVLIALGQLTNVLGGAPDFRTSFGQNVVLLSYIAFVFAFVGLYAVLAERGGILAQLGVVLGPIGATLLAANVFRALSVEHLGTLSEDFSEAAISTLAVVLRSWSVYVIVGALLFVIALVLFGIATLQVGVFPRWAGLLLIIGAALTFLAKALHGIASLSQFTDAIAGVVTGAGVAWLGWELLSGRGQEPQQPATRVR